jgi:hypothetical protein
MWIVVLWVVMQCSLLREYKHFEGMYHFHFQVYLEDGGYMIIQKYGTTAQKPQPTLSLS